MEDEKVLAELKRLEADNGGLLLPHLVVAAARAPQSPLHEHFEWDDSKAAANFRLVQARQLIRVCVEYVGSSETRQKINAFVSLTTDRQDGGGYRSLTKVLQMDSMRAQMLADARLEMERFRAKFATIEELAGVVHAMDEAEMKIKSAPAKRKRA